MSKNQSRVNPPRIDGRSTPVGSPSSVAASHRAAPPFADVLGMLLPLPTETLLLRACLMSGEPAKTAWRSWSKKVGEWFDSSQTRSAAFKELLPLIHTAIQRNDLKSETSQVTRTRAAFLREELRARTYREICGQVLMDLATEGIPLIALRDCALAETVYADPASRHCRAIDLLLRKADEERATSLLAERGWTRAGTRCPKGFDHIYYRHSSGLRLVLHFRLSPTADRTLTLDTLWAASRTAPIAGTETRILTPADSLLDICIRAADCRVSSGLLWVCDAWRLIDCHPDLDWQLFLDRTVDCGLALPLFVVIVYLREELGAPVPAEVVAALQETATKASREDCETALLGKLTTLSALRRALLTEAQSWRARVAVLRFVVWPSPDILRREFGVRDPVRLLLIYLYRPCRYLLSRTWRQIRSGRRTSRRGGA